MRKILFILSLFLTVSLSGQILPGVVASQRVVAAGGAAYTDDFESYGSYTWASETTLTGLGNWIAGSSGKPMIIADDSGDNRVSGDLNAARGALIYNNTFANNQYAQVTIDEVGATSYIGVGVRLTGSGATLDGYIILCNSSTTRLYRIDNGAYTSLEIFTATRIATDIIKLTVSGTTLQGYINGTVIDWDVAGTSVTDATYSSGKGGLAGYHWVNDTKGDNWAGGDL